MATITAADVNKLRQMTGAGMMDCKNALAENEGDFEKAIDYLRKKGQKLAAKRADRDANEGLIFAQGTANHNFACITTISSETDFVAKNEEFVNFAKKIADLALVQKPKNLEDAKAMLMDGRSVSEHITDMVGKIGEKIEFAAYACLEAPYVAAYTHHGNRLGTIVSFDKEISDEVAHNVAMQVAAMSPIAVDEKFVSQEVIDRELEIARDQVRAEGKPEDKVEMIAQGKLNKYFKENTLLNQEFIKDSKMNVGQYLTANGGASVLAFFRLKLGE